MICPLRGLRRTGPHISQASAHTTTFPSLKRELLFPVEGNNRTPEPVLARKCLCSGRKLLSWLSSCLWLHPEEAAVGAAVLSKGTNISAGQEREH